MIILFNVHIFRLLTRIPTNESIDKQQQQQKTYNNNYRTVRSDKQPINVDNVSVNIYILIHYECKLHVVKLVEHQC